jgi:ferritin-like metal-binding protein YciE
MQITDALRRAGSDIGVVHTVQVLEAALQNEKSVEQGVNNKIKNGSRRLQPAKI